jgi:hypothetical protein
MLEHGIFHEAFVVAREQPTASEPVSARPRVVVNGHAVRDPDPALVPDHLGDVVQLVAETLAAHGERLLAGDVVLSGSFTPPVPVRVGDRIDECREAACTAHGAPREDSAMFIPSLLPCHAADEIVACPLACRATEVRQVGVAIAATAGCGPQQGPFASGTIA